MLQNVNLVSVSIAKVKSLLIAMLKAVNRLWVTKMRRNFAMSIRENTTH